MEKKSLLAVLLSAAVLFVYYNYIYIPPESSTQSTVTQADSQQPNVSGPESPQVGTGSQPAATPPATPAQWPLAGGPEIQGPVFHKIVETSLSQIVLTSQTGLPANWWLQEFFVNPDNTGEHINLLGDLGQKAPALSLLLFPDQNAIAPFFQTREEDSHKVNYVAQVGEVALQQNLRFSTDNYSLSIDLTVENLSAQTQMFAPGLRLANLQTLTASKGFLFFKEPPNQKVPVYRMGNTVKRERSVDKLGVYSETTGDISWVGLEDRYFLRLILARNLSSRNKVAYGQKDGTIFVDFRYETEALAPGQKKDYSFVLYLGPKDLTLLGKFGGANLEKAVDYGWFGFLCKPILQLMKFFHSFLGNWGLAIIALTILIKVLLYPMTRKSMKSMKSMQDLQPQIKKIREQYKDDRQRLNVETMQLFKTHKVNPMGGCLPMLIQMPVYIALYKVLYNATDLFHAPFFWFYHDLSAPDPYFILPILLGLFMFLQQKMTPTVMDPAQAKMMLLMPIMFSVFMFFLPVGLVVYILVNTVMTVAQQWMHQKDISILQLLRRRQRV